MQGDAERIGCCIIIEYMSSHDQVNDARLSCGMQFIRSHPISISTITPEISEQDPRHDERKGNRSIGGSMESKLTGTHATTYQRLFQHPTPHNLQWRDVVSMLGAVADVITREDEEGNLKLTRNGRTITLHRPRGKDFADHEELMHVRHFLEGSGAVVPPQAPSGVHLLVVIDHREARIYTAESRGTVPERISPYDPFGFGRALHYNQDDSNGQRKPELKSFYEAVAKTLHNAEKILMFGTGTGASNAMDHLILDLKHNHPDIARKVVASETVDEHHLTYDQLLAKAREVFVTA
jgi:hypothetical protein